METSALESVVLFVCTVLHESLSSDHDFTLSSFWHAFINNFILLFPLRNFWSLHLAFGLRNQINAAACDCLPCAQCAGDEQCWCSASAL